MQTKASRPRQYRWSISGLSRQRSKVAPYPATSLCHGVLSNQRALRGFCKMWTPSYRLTWRMYMIVSTIMVDGIFRMSLQCVHGEEHTQLDKFLFFSSLSLIFVFVFTYELRCWLGVQAAWISRLSIQVHAGENLKRCLSCLSIWSLSCSLPNCSPNELCRCFETFCGGARQCYV